MLSHWKVVVRRRPELVRSAAFLAGVALLAGSCTRTLVVTGPGAIPPDSRGVLDTSGLRPTQASQPNYAHLLTPTILAFCNAMEWTNVCTVPEFTDDQALMGDAQDGYGPHAFVSPAANLGDHVDENAFANYLLVGMVVVDNGNVPNTYREMHLDVGFNCLYIRHQGGDWFGKFGRGSMTCPAQPPAGAGDVTVKAARPPAGYSAADIPPVARFRENGKGANKGFGGVGLRCGNRWCFMLPSRTSPADTLPLRHKPDHPMEKTWIVHGWHDVQTLSLPPTTAPGEPVRTRAEAAAIPTRELATYNSGPFPTTFVHVATVRLWDQPPGRYQTEWKFRRGFNEIWMRRVPGTGGAPDTWEAELRHWFILSGTRTLVTTRRLSVERFDHGRPTPSTARFLWSGADEDLWVSCEDGCCKVTPGGFQ